jgi:type I restriction enzyme S subunit
MTSAAEGWLGVLPDGWALVPSKAAFEERREPNRPSDVHLTPSQIHGVLPQSEYMVRTGNSVVQNLQGQDDMKHVEPDDFVIHLRSFQGGIERSTHSGKVSTAYTVLAPKRLVVADYYRWLLKSDGYIQELRTTTNQLRDGQSIKFADFAKVRLPVPPQPEQRAIADYLDHETAGIDTLIEEQQCLIKMLRERRDGVVSHAVLNSTEKRTALRRVVDVIDCAHVTATFVDEDDRFPVASIRECQGTLVDLSRCNYTTAEFFEHLRASDRAPRIGDLLFVRNVSVGLVSAIAPGTPQFALGQETVLLRRKIDVDPTFIRHALNAAETRHAIEAAMIGSTFRRINVSAIRGLMVPLPPFREQRRIVEHLDEQTAKIDELIAETERFIELARERRSALITAAVTGHIDVQAAP